MKSARFVFCGSYDSDEIRILLLLEKTDAFSISACVGSRSSDRTKSVSVTFPGVSLLNQPYDEQSSLPKESLVHN